MMTRLQGILIGVLGSVAAIGLAFGITTPSAVQAKTELREVEFQGDRLFHSPRLGSTSYSCNDCHVDGGRFSHHLGAHRIPSLVSTKNQFPRTDASGQVTTLEDAINQCITANLHGRALPQSSQKLALLDLYLRHLTRFHER